MEVVAWGKKKGLTGGVRLTMREEREGDQLGRSKPKRETHFCGGAICTWARQASEGCCGLRGRFAPTRAELGRSGQTQERIQMKI
jgi:hypothetical protein